MTWRFRLRRWLRRWREREQTAPRVALTLTLGEARSLERAVRVLRDGFLAGGARDAMSAPRGTTTLEVAHSKVVNAIERHEVAA